MFPNFLNERLESYSKIIWAGITLDIGMFPILQTGITIVWDYVKVRTHEFKNNPELSSITPYRYSSFFIKKPFKNKILEGFILW